MERIKLNQIRLGKLMCINPFEYEPSAVLGSEYGFSCFKIGYIKDGKFIDKHNDEYRVCNILKLTRGFDRSLPHQVYYEGEKPLQGEKFIDLDKDYIIKLPYAVSSEDISPLLDSIERLFYEVLDSKEHIDFKKIVDQEYNKSLLKTKKH